ncbi:hypothetical protein F383_25680 [Gossypium arboreum]|uniref:Uncharacterized protein n=1 Tax=Gossypium arboreum TaxID=29729 RepID=A0A0B0P8M0_GOSAR|nr:hypothetical protein F383_25680 [Gossypium arboreum]
MFIFHLSCNSNKRISFTHVLGYEFYYCELCYILQKFWIPYLFELRLLLTSKYMSHAYIHNPSSTQD